MEFYIERPPMSKTVEIYAFEQRGDNDRFYSYDGKGKIIVEDIPRFQTSEKVKPLIVMSSWMFDQLKMHMVSLAHQEGVKPESQHKLEGTLEATRDHLDDLRSILWLQLGMGAVEKEEKL